MNTPAKYLLLFVMLAAFRTALQAATYPSSGNGEFSTIFPLATLASGDSLIIQNGHTVTVSTGINDYSPAGTLIVIVQNGGTLELVDILGVLHLGTGSKVEVETGGQIIATGIAGGITTGITIAGGGIIPPAYSPLFGDNNPLNGPAVIDATNGTVTLTELYSITSGDWNTPGTWSTSASGSSCGCVPGATDLAIVQSGHIIRISTNAESAGLTILNGGRVEWTASASLTIRNSGNMAIEDTGTLDENSQVNASIVLDNASASSITCGGTIYLDALTYSTSAAAVHLTVTGSFTLPNTLYIGAGSKLYVSAAGSVAIQNLDAANNDFTFNNFGTVTMNGSFLNMGGTEYLNNRSGGTWNYYGATFAAGTELYCDVDGANTFVYTYDAGTQDVIVPRDAYWHLTLAGAGAKDFTGDFSIKGDFVLNDNGVSVLYNTTNITFNGTVQQTMRFAGSNSNMAFYDLTINNTSGSIPAIRVQNCIDLLINNSLTLTQGVVDVTGATYGAYFQASATVTPPGGSAGSYIDGIIYKNGTAAFDFPTGDGNIWAPIGITAPATSTTFAARYYDAPYSDLTTDGTFSHVSAAEHWVLDRTSGTGTVNVTLHWKDDTRSEIVDLGDLRVARWDGSQWVSEGQNANSGTLSPAGWIQSNTVSSFSPFTFASQNGLNPLPVALVAFSARQAGDAVELTWQTASEINNDYFTLERSYDGEQYEPIATIAGNGTTASPRSYRHRDIPLYAGLIYYRLSQTDYDGTTEVFDPVSVRFAPATAIQVFPNPAAGRQISILISRPVNRAEVVLTSLMGQVVWRHTYRQTEGLLQIRLTDVPPGMYFLQVNTDTGRHRQKIYLP